MKGILHIGSYLGKVLLSPFLWWKELRLRDMKELGCVMRVGRYQSQNLNLACLSFESLVLSIGPYHFLRTKSLCRLAQWYLP